MMDPLPTSTVTGQPEIVTIVRGYCFNYNYHVPSPSSSSMRVEETEISMASVSRDFMMEGSCLWHEGEENIRSHVYPDKPPQS